MEMKTEIKIHKSEELAAQIEAFDTFWEGPENVEKGYTTLYTFYKHNYLKYLPSDKNVNTLVISCGPGYFVDMMNRHGYKNVLGIDSDPQKIEYGIGRGLNLKAERVFEFLYLNLKSGNKFDLIIAEQEINHLAKDELIDFLILCKENLTENGTLIVHVINGANPIVGSESLAQNFDHYFTFTEYSLKQVLEYTKFNEIKIFPLNLYVFFSNPFNYIALLVDKINTLFFRINFILYGKSNKIFTKKIAAICKK
jgi:2-polyprenyl-3-methyl-5-hydroxy-6-metoxy-1,4-benzoquinol methylase